MYNEKGLLMIKGTKESLTSIINDIFGSTSISETLDIGKADTFAKIYTLNYEKELIPDSSINILGNENLKTKSRDSIEMFKERDSENYIIKMDFEATQKPNELFFGYTFSDISEKYKDVSIKANTYSEYFGIYRRLSFKDGKIVYNEELDLSQYFNVI